MTVSAGVQRTQYDFTDDYVDDISFNASSTSIGFGAKIKVAKNLNVNVAYFHTFYDTYERNQADYNHVGATIKGLANGLQQGIAQGLTTPEGQAIANITGLNVQQLSGAVQGMMQQIGQTDFSGSDKFTRTNRVIGIGVDWSF